MKQFILFEWLYYCRIHFHTDFLPLKSVFLKYTHNDSSFAFRGNLDYCYSFSIAALQMFEENHHEVGWCYHQSIQFGSGLGTRSATVGCVWFWESAITSSATPHYIQSCVGARWQPSLLSPLLSVISLCLLKMNHGGSILRKVSGKCCKSELLVDLFFVLPAYHLP